MLCACLHCFHCVKEKHKIAFQYSWLILNLFVWFLRVYIKRCFKTRVFILFLWKFSGTSYCFNASLERRIGCFGGEVEKNYCSLTRLKAGPWLIKELTKKVKNLNLLSSQSSLLDSSRFFHFDCLSSTVKIRCMATSEYFWKENIYTQCRCWLVGCFED